MVLGIKRNMVAKHEVTAVLRALEDCLRSVLHSRCVCSEETKVAEEVLAVASLSDPLIMLLKETKFSQLRQ